MVGISRVSPSSRLSWTAFYFSQIAPKTLNCSESSLWGSIGDENNAQAGRWYRDVLGPNVAPVFLYLLILQSVQEEFLSRQLATVERTSRNSYPSSLETHREAYLSGLEATSRFAKSRAVGVRIDVVAGLSVK